VAFIAPQWAARFMTRHITGDLPAPATPSSSNVGTLPSASPAV